MSTVNTQKKFGKEIGMSRYDEWHMAHGVSMSDLYSMPPEERAKFITKDNVWRKPDYDGMVMNGVPLLTVYKQKLFREAVKAKPMDDDDIADYLALVDDFTKMSERSDENPLTLLLEFGYLVNVYHSIRITSKNRADQYLIDDKIHKLLQSDYTMERLAKETGLGEETKSPKGYMIKSYKEAANILWMIAKKQGRYNYILEDGFETREDAARRAKEIAFFNKKASEKKKFTEEELKDRKRVGPVYHVLFVTEDQMLDELKLKGGEFGKNLPDKEKQMHLDESYDAFCDMADVLKISHDHISLGNRVSIAYAARGRSGAVAHYEPLREVINLTRKKGAGSLGHEMMHAIDDILGKQFGCGGAMTEHESKAPESFKRLMDAMVYRDQTMEEAKNDQEEANRKNKAKADRYVASVKRMICSLIPDRELTADLIEERNALIDAYVTSSEPYLFGKEHSAVEALSQFSRTHLGHVLKKSDRDYFSRMKFYMEVSEAALEIKRVHTDFFENSAKMDESFTSTGNGYWASRIELFARAGACYLTDKLKEAGRRNDYLSGHSEGYPLPDGSGYAIPKGEERRVIDELFDAFFEDMRNRNLI